MDMKLNMILDNDPLKVELSRQAKLKGISIEKLIAEILRDYVDMKEGIL